MIKENVKEILNQLPDGVELVAAVKGREAEEVLEAIEAGVKIIGQNFIGEAKRAYQKIGKKVKWHFIGIPGMGKHDLTRKKVLEIFDMIETIDSFEIAAEIDKGCAKIGKIMPILIEINSGKESQKSGALPQKAVTLIREISALSNIKIMGLMTMGPWSGNPEDSRSYFTATRKLFDEIKKLNLSNVKMRYLSMGMTNSYRVAIEEGANILRIGSKIFGKRS